MSAPQMKPEYDHGDYPIDRFAYDAQRALSDYLAVANLTAAQARPFEVCVELLNLHMLDDMAGFDVNAPF